MKILAIDDSVFVLKMLQKQLSEYCPEAEVLTADNGLRGYTLYQEAKPDLIITDLLMPELSGQHLIALIREADPQVVIIVLSADVQSATRQELQQYHISGFINKPLTGDKTSQLIQIIKEADHA